MSLTRREFLRLGALALASATGASCTAVGRELARRQLPASLSVPLPESEMTDESAAQIRLWRMLNRAGFGPRPGDLGEARQLGFETYLEAQLRPETLEDTPADLLVRGLSNYNMGLDQLLGQEDRRGSALDLGIATMGRALLSRRQLYEVMVSFWTDHFNVYVAKNQRLLYLKIVDDREVIRPHALGKFPDLLRASARSPAMLVYLDNVANVKRAPNENYARELMELHTMGVDGGYTQQDVQEVARALTGWSVVRRGPRQGEFQFAPERHDDGQKRVLGYVLPAGQGQEDVYDVLDILATHPATARFVAFKLVRRFVADDPPEPLVERVANAFASSGGDVKTTLRTLFLSEAFATAPPKLKRPFHFAVSALRALQADVPLTPLSRAPRQLAQWLQRMGQPIFQWPAPDGYPHVASAWTGSLLPRWNFALALLQGQVNGITVPVASLADAGGVTNGREAVDFFAGLLLNRPLSDEVRSMIADYVGSGPVDDPQTEVRLRDAVALLLASPAFQWT